MTPAPMTGMGTVCPWVWSVMTRILTPLFYVRWGRFVSTTSNAAKTEPVKRVSVDALEIGMVCNATSVPRTGVEKIATVAAEDGREKPVASVPKTGREKTAIVAVEAGWEEVVTSVPKTGRAKSVIFHWLLA